MTRRWLVLVLAGVVALSVGGDARAIVGGQVVPIESVPWQVAVGTPSQRCGGAILDARRILTAAHCVLGVAPTSMTVIAGTTSSRAATPGAQTVAVASVRSHPYWLELGQPDDDVAVVTTARPLDLTRPSAQPIPLPPPGAMKPPAGTVLSVSGYGVQERRQPAPDHLLRVAQFPPRIFQQTCGFADRHDAVLVCAPNSPQAGTCEGDSGGPLTAGSPPVLVGIVGGAGDFDACAKTIGTYADVTAPEIRQFIDGSDAPPKAPRGHGGGLSPGVGLHAGQAVTCRGGEWTESARITYDFVQFEDDDDEPAFEPTVLQSGPSRRFVTTRRHAGRWIGCVVKATSAGGTGADETYGVEVERSHSRPRVRITRARCRGRRCDVRFTIREKRSDAGPSRVTARIGRRALRVRRAGGSRYRATGRRPRGAGLRVRVRAVSAASGRSRTASHVIGR